MLLTVFPSPPPFPPILLPSPRQLGLRELAMLSLTLSRLPLLFLCEITRVHTYSHSQIHHKQHHFQAESGAAIAILTYILSCAGAACSLLPSQSNVKDTGLSHRWPQRLEALGQRSNIHSDCINTKPKEAGMLASFLSAGCCNFFLSHLSTLPTRRSRSLRSDFLMPCSWIQTYSKRMTP